MLLKVININPTLFLRLFLSKYKIYVVNAATTVFQLTVKVIVEVME